MASDSSQRTLLSEIAAAATDNADNTAFVCPVMGGVSYSEFSAASSLLAAELQRLGVSAAGRVAIYLQRSAAAVISMHASLLAGACYVPIAHSMPEQRVRHIVSDSQPAVVICDASTREPARAIANEFEAALVELAVTVDGIEIPGNPARGGGASAVPDGSPCYMLYTSGSTGQPKGVVVSRANVLDYMDWAIPYFEISSRDRILATAPFYFDMSTFDIYASLLSGATLVIASERDCMFPKFLMQKISDYEVTIWKAVSALFAHVSSVAKLDAEKLASLRALIFSGERLPTHYLVEWMQAHPGASYYNAYGPTEATGISSCYRIRDIPDEAESIPIGRPCTNTQVYLFDDERLVEEQGRPGEIVIGGAGVAAGYWQDKAKTSRAFVTKIGQHRFANPVYRSGDIGVLNEHGDLEFVARIDRQIKHQGYRIELDDIEAALRSVADVTDAAVVHLARGRASELAAYFEARSELVDASVRGELTNRLPHYMVPRTVKQVARLPRTDRGKIDYEQLVSQAQ